MTDANNYTIIFTYVQARWKINSNRTVYFGVLMWHSEWFGFHYKILFLIFYVERSRFNYCNRALNWYSMWVCVTDMVHDKNFIQYPTSKRGGLIARMSKGKTIIKNLKISLEPNMSSRTCICIETRNSRNPLDIGQKPLIHKRRPQKPYVYFQKVIFTYL